MYVIEHRIVESRSFIPGLEVAHGDFGKKLIALVGTINAALSGTSLKITSMFYDPETATYHYCVPAYYHAA